MLSPEISGSLSAEVPEGAIFLPPDNMTASEIEGKLAQMFLCRGELGDLDPQIKLILAAQLVTQRSQLADLAMRAL